MADSRPLPCNFWSWPKIADLLLDQKALAAYLFTNRFTTSCGCYELPRRLVAGELGVTVPVLEEAIRQFGILELIATDERTGEVLILDWYRFHKFTTGPQLVNFWRARDKIQSARLKKMVVDRSLASGVPQSKKNDIHANNQGDGCQQQRQLQRQQKIDYQALLAASEAAVTHQARHDGY